MFELKLEIADAHGVTLSTTQHATLAEALAEFKGWQRAGATTYRVTGSMLVEDACKRIMESRNREIYVHFGMSVQPYTTCVNAETALGVLDFSAPQACKMLRALKLAGDATRTQVDITNSTFHVGCV